LNAQVRLLQAQMATLQVQANDEELEVATRAVSGSRGKEIADEDDEPVAASAASASATTTPLTSAQPIRRDDDDGPAADLRRRRLQAFRSD
jgi:hypothetical protein